ncbi:MAG: hypothetical protein QGI83_10580 [Candidatus Latescibacteria bacterium]|jgi:septal ring factor EnvC (AmiA/AmiB activator)|nr:hypothetical protein [Candidatus Latescibacterota bacterium]
MTLVLVAVILAGLGYAISVLSEHRSFLEDAQPRIRQLEEQAGKLERLVKRETDELREARDWLESERGEIAGIQEMLAETDAKIKSLRKTEHELEMATYKQEFRSSKKHA